jgi:hypothetical protein
MPAPFGPRRRKNGLIRPRASSDARARRYQAARERSDVQKPIENGAHGAPRASVETRHGSPIRQSREVTSE